MAVVCPTITAVDPHEYRAQMVAIEPFAKRVHIDLMDGEFAPSKSPSLDHVWWPHKMTADLHLMYQNPMDFIDKLVKLKPSLVIIHNEAQVHHMHFAAVLHKHDIQAGLALLQDTPVAYARQIIHSFDHILVFSGQLGFHGGHADLSLVDKVREIRALHPEAEISWDGGINSDNAKQLVSAGVDVLNTGGYIQKADNPANAYATISSVINDKQT